MLRTGGRKGLRGTKHAPKAQRVLDSLVSRELPRAHHKTPLLGDCSSSGASSLDAASVLAFWGLGPRDIDGCVNRNAPPLPHGEGATNDQITCQRRGESDHSAYDEFPPLNCSHPASSIPLTCTMRAPRDKIPPHSSRLVSLSTAQLKREAMTMTESLLRKSLRCDDARTTALGVGFAMRAAAHLMREDEKVENELPSQSQRALTPHIHIHALPPPSSGAVRGRKGGGQTQKKGNTETAVSYTGKGRGADTYKTLPILADPCSLDRRSSLLSFQKKAAASFRDAPQVPARVVAKHPLSPSPSPFFFTRRELSTIIIPALVQLHANWVPRSWADVPTRVTDGTTDISIGNSCDPRRRNSNLYGGEASTLRNESSSAEEVPHRQRRRVVKVLLRKLLGGLRVEDCSRCRESQHGGGAGFLDDGRTQNLMARGYPASTLEENSLPRRRFLFVPPYRGVTITPSAVGHILLRHERDDHAFPEKSDYGIYGMHFLAERRVATASLLEALITFNDKSTIINPLLSWQQVGSAAKNTPQQNVDLAGSLAPLSEGPTPQSALISTANTTAAGIGNFPSSGNRNNKSKYSGFSSLEALSIFNLGAIDPLDRLYFCVRHPDPSGNDFRPPFLIPTTERPAKQTPTKQTAPSLFPSSDGDVPHSVFTSGRWKVMDPRQCNVLEDCRTRRGATSDTQPADGEPHLLQSPTTPRRPPQPRWLARPFREANKFLDMAMRAQTSAYHGNTHLTGFRLQKGFAESRQKRSGTSSTPSQTNNLYMGTQKSCDFLRDPLWFKAHALAWLRNEAKVQMAGTLFVPTNSSAKTKMTLENNAKSTCATTNQNFQRSSKVPQKRVGASTFYMRLCGVKQPSVELSGQLQRKGEDQLALCQTPQNVFVSDSRKGAAAQFNLPDFAASARQVKSQKELWERVCAVRDTFSVKSRGDDNGYASQTSSGWLRRAPWRSFEKCVERSAKAAIARENHFESHSSLSAIISPFADANAYAFPYWIDALSVKQMNLRLLPNARGLLMTDSMTLSGLLGVRDFATVRIGLAVAAVGDFYDKKIAQLTAASAEVEEAPTSSPPPSLAVHSPQDSPPCLYEAGASSSTCTKKCISKATLLDSIVADGIRADLSIDLSADDEMSDDFEGEEGLLTQGWASDVNDVQDSSGKEGTAVCKSALLESVTISYMATDLGIGRSETVALEDAARSWRSESPVSQDSMCVLGSSACAWVNEGEGSSDIPEVPFETCPAGPPVFYSCADVIWSHNPKRSNEESEEAHSINGSASSLLQNLLEWLEDLKLSEFTSRPKKKGYLR